MGIYRKIEVQLWSDKKVRKLSRMPACGQGLWLYLLTGPHTGRIPGLSRAGKASMAEELGWSLKDFDRAFAEISEAGMVKADFEARLVWLPNALSHNRPESPNVVTSWVSDFELLPECSLRDEALGQMAGEICSMGESFAKAFTQAFGRVVKASPKASPKAMANQEQEQEQEQEEEREGAREGKATDPPGHVSEIALTAWGILRDAVYQPATEARFMAAWPTLGLEGISCDDIFKAIANFGLILKGPPGRYWWSRKVTFERWAKDHIAKFLPTSFREEDFLADGSTGVGGALSLRPDAWTDEQRRAHQREIEERSSNEPGEVNLAELAQGTPLERMFSQEAVGAG